jgi:hypothetical protein
MLTTAMRPRPWITLLAIAAVLLHASTATSHTSRAFAGRPGIDALGLDLASICRGGRADASRGSNHRQAPKPADSQGTCDICCPVPVFVLGPETAVLPAPASRAAGEARPIVLVPTPSTAVWPPARGPPALA